MIAFAVLVLGAPTTALGGASDAPQGDSSWATLTVLEERVALIDGETGETHSGATGELVQAGDRLQTADPGRALLTFADGSEFEMEPATEVLIQHLGQTAGGGTLTAIAQAVGATVHRVAELGTTSTYEVQTPSATTVVRGTVFRIRVVRGPLARRPIEEQISVEEGTVEVRLPAGSHTVQAGQGLRVIRSAGPDAEEDGESVLVEILAPDDAGAPSNGEGPDDDGATDGPLEGIADEASGAGEQVDDLGDAVDDLAEVVDDETEPPDLPPLP